MGLQGVSFVVPGRPRPKGNSKQGFIVNRGKPNARAIITDSKSTKAAVAHFTGACSPFAPASPIQGPVRLVLAFYMPHVAKPPKWFVNATDDGVAYHDKRPDVDNLTKLVLDVLTKLGFWRDDAQVVTLIVRKHLAEPGAVGCTSIHIQELFSVTSGKEYAAWLATEE